MADNYLERQRELYETKKAAWLKKKKHLPKQKPLLEKPEDEAL